MDEWISRLKSDKHKHLAAILLLMSLGQMGLVIFGFKVIFQEESFLYASLIRVSAILMCFLQGCAGFVMMFRREFPQGIMIRGCAAQVMGFIFGLISWFLALYILVYTLSLSS